MVGRAEPRQVESGSLASQLSLPLPLPLQLDLIQREIKQHHMKLGSCKFEILFLLIINYLIAFPSSLARWRSG